MKYKERNLFFNFATRQINISPYIKKPGSFLFRQLQNFSNFILNATLDIIVVKNFTFVFFCIKKIL